MYLTDEHVFWWLVLLVVLRVAGVVFPQDRPVAHVAAAVKFQIAQVRSEVTPTTIYLRIYVRLYVNHKSQLSFFRFHRFTSKFSSFIRFLRIFLKSIFTVFMIWFSPTWIFTLLLFFHTRFPGFFPRIFSLRSATRRHNGHNTTRFRTS